MADLDFEQVRLRFNGIANVTFGLSLIAATVISAIAILQTGWPWWQCGLGLCGLGLLWAIIFSIISHSADLKARSR